MLKHENFRWAFVCSKLTIETLKQGMKYVQSYKLRHQNNVNDVKIKCIKVYGLCSVFHIFQNVLSRSIILNPLEDIVHSVHA